MGSGKTVVGHRRGQAIAAQVALMAPTEILAEQHFRKLAAFAAAGREHRLMTGSLTAKARREAAAAGRGQRSWWSARRR